MDTFFTDVRYAIRGLMKAPGVAAIAVVALALGIGLTTLMFSIVYGIVFRGLPFEGGDRIMAVWQTVPSRDIAQRDVPTHDFVEYAARQRSFESLSAYRERTVNLTFGDRPERFPGALMSGDAMGALGASPLLGRFVTEEDVRPGAPAVVVLGYRPWRDLFGSDRSVVGRTVKVDGAPATVIGVMPEGYQFPGNHQVWLPLSIDLTVARGEGSFHGVFGRLREGVSADAAMADLGRIASDLASAYPESNEGVVPIVEGFTEDALDEGVKAMLFTMLATVGLVLLIACANVANLLLARAATRARDVAVRVSLGASRQRVVLQLMSEALLLALVGAGLGAVLAKTGLGLFEKAIAADPPPFWIFFALDTPILLFVAFVTAVAAVASGAIPALRASSADLNAVLKDESRGSSSLSIGRLSRGLVIAEVAMSLALLVAAGLLVRSAITLDRKQLAYPTEDVFTARITLTADRFADGPSQERFWEQLQARVEAFPGVRSAALTDVLPGIGTSRGAVQIEGASYSNDRDIPVARWVRVTPGFFRTFDVSLVQGRAFTELDGADAPAVAIVNESYARQFFPDGNALGRRIKVGTSVSTRPWREIVGVIPDLDMQRVGDPADEAAGLYVPMAQDPQSYASIAVRAQGDPLALTQAVREAVVAIDPDTPIFQIDTLRGRIAVELWFYGVFGKLFAVFGGAALFMASVGLYGVMSFSVTSRVSEIGIRMALGAQRGQVLRLILRQGMTQIGIGMLIGTGLALPIAKGLQFLLLDQRPWDPTTYFTVFAVLALTGLAATAIPAARATRVDPSDALRAE